ncbi:hypothetical protein H8D30_01730 [bacterium]|nr:hypothetical protein [bacterium]
MYQYNKKGFGVLLGLFFLLGVLLPAQGGQRGEKKSVSSWIKKNDTNEDGKVCPDESDLPAEIFDRLDQDGDGCFNAEEAGASKGGPQRDRQRNMLSGLDKDGDGKVCLEDLPNDRPEMVERGKEMLARHDKDGDGCLSGDEIPQGGSNPGGNRNLWSMLVPLDRNGDGLVCRDEVPLYDMRATGRIGELYIEYLDVGDINNDNCLEESEVNIPLEERAQWEHLSRMDMNGDGLVCTDEMPLTDRGSENPQSLIQRLDKNGDGCLSEDEAALPPTPQSPWARISTMDLNGDGLVCRDEVPDVLFGEGGRFGRGQDAPPRSADQGRRGEGQGRGSFGRPPEPPSPEMEFNAMLRSFDHDGDRCLSESEIPQGPVGGGISWSHFERMDTNKDGLVCMDEWAAISDGFQGRPQQEGRGGLQGNPQGGRPERGRRPDFGQILEKLDLNGDRCIEESEIPTPPQQGQGNRKPRGANFVERFDANGDGAVSPDEFDGPEDVFAKLDQNGDGLIDHADLDH